MNLLIAQLSLIVCVDADDLEDFIVVTDLFFYFYIKAVIER